MVLAMGWLSTSTRTFNNNAPADKGGRVAWRYRLPPQTGSDAVSA